MTASAATIQSWTSRARLGGNAPYAAAARLDRLARHDLPRRVSDHLAEAAPADRRVVLIRKLRVRGRLAGRASDTELADAWGKLLAEGILRSADEHESPDDVCIFADRAEWIAACVGDALARQSVHAAWWYGPLAQVIAGATLPQALLRLIEQERAETPRILACVDGRGILQGLLNTLAAPDRARLVSLCAQPTERDHVAHDRLRPILAAALDVLGLRYAPSEREALLDSWLAHGGAEEPDWRSAAALTRSVAAACRFLAQSGRIGAAQLADAARSQRPPPWLDPDALRRELEAAPDTASPIVAALRAALRERDLDPDRLTLTALARLAAGNTDPASMQHARHLIQHAAPLVVRLAELPTSSRGAALRAYRDGTGGALADGGDPHDAALRSSIAPLLESVLAGRPIVAAASEDSTCIGTAVMLRALADVDLARALAQARGIAPSLPDRPGIVAAALMCAWAGPAAVDAGGRLDAGIALLLGSEVPRDAAALAASLARCDSDALDALADAVAQIVAAQSPGAGALPECDLAALAGPPSLSLDPAFARIAWRLLTHWARWLQGFERSSALWLLERTIRRPGRIAASDGRLTVALPPLPLDVALRRAGYLDPLALPGWMPWRQISFLVHEMN